MTKKTTTNKPHRGTDAATGRHVNASALAREVGLSRQRIGVLLSEGHTPSAIRRRQARKAEAAAATGGDGQSHGDRPRRKAETLLAARTRKERSLANMRELEFKERQGALVSRAQVEAESADEVVRVRDRLLRIGPELRDRCDRQPGAVVEALINEEVQGILTSFSRALGVTEADVERWREFLEWAKKRESNGKA